MYTVLLTYFAAVAETHVFAAAQTHAIATAHAFDTAHAHAIATLSKDTAEEQANRSANANLFRLVYAYRNYGHLQADIDPLGIQTKPYST